jgi:hypothetical protein
MFITSGSDTYGRVKTVGGVPVVSKFFMLQFLPLYPLQSDNPRMRLIEQLIQTRVRIAQDLDDGSLERKTDQLLGELDLTSKAASDRPAN